MTPTQMRQARRALAVPSGDEHGGTSEAAGPGVAGPGQPMRRIPGAGVENPPRGPAAEPRHPLKPWQRQTLERLGRAGAVSWADLPAGPHRGRVMRFITWLEQAGVARWNPAAGCLTLTDPAGLRRMLAWDGTGSLTRILRTARIADASRPDPLDASRR
jgi:hypothetical protein